MIKYCPRCKQNKEDSEFSQRKERYDGLAPFCKECMMVYYKKYREDNYVPRIPKPKKPERVIGGRDKCHRCGVVFYGPEYGYTPTKIDGYDYCDSCVNDLNKEKC